MRGDSLRDLYAKTLALVGLGVLAAVGALFDYWPAGIRLVPAAPALELPELASSFPVVPAAAALETDHPGLPTRPRNVRAQLPVTQTTDIRLASVSEPLRPLAELTPVAFVPVHASLPEPLLTTASITLESERDERPAPLESLALPEDSYPESVAAATWREPVSLATSATAADDDGGFLTDALRKTRTSLVRTGARTGASIVDAVRVVGGAVRRALPN